MQVGLSPVYQQNTHIQTKNQQPRWKMQLPALWPSCLTTLRLPKVTVAIPDKISTVASFLASCNPLHKSQGKLPRDESVVRKTLDNGLTYYVRKNDYPYAKKAYLRLVINVGMLNEKPEEKGIAHLIEHIVQVETESFAKDEIMTYLSSKGVHWSKDNNAYTAPNETVYMLDIPLEDADTLEKCLSILSEVANKANLTNDIIDNEREIVIDEISQKRSAAIRYTAAKRRIICEGNPYETLVDREKEIKSVKECSPDIIRGFYKRWYQPENMAVIAVGDFDQKKTCDLIEKHFGKIPSLGHEPSKHNYHLKKNMGTRFLCFSDPEMVYSFVEVIHLLPRLKFSTEMEEQRMSLMIDMFEDIVNRRLDEVCEQSNTALVKAQCENGEILSGYPYFKFFAAAKEGQTPEACRELLLEIKRIKTHGFLQSEFDSVKRENLASIEHDIRQNGQTTSTAFVKKCHSHFINNAAMLDFDKIGSIEKRLLEKITLEDINALASHLLSETDRLVGTSMPEKPGLDVVTENDLKRQIAAVGQERVEPLKEEGVQMPLMKKLPKPGKIKQTKYHKNVNITEYILNNGMKVFFKPTKFKNDEVSIKACSVGGTRDAEISKIASAKFSNDFYDTCGIGDFDRKTLDKVLSGKTVVFKPYIGDYLTILDAASVPKDLETAFQLFNLMFTNPGYDAAAFQKAIKIDEEFLRNQDNNPNTAFVREIVAAKTQGHPAFKSLKFEDLKHVDYEACKSFHQHKFSNPANFTVAIVGNAEARKVKKLVERYFASLEKTGEKRTTFEYSPVPFPEGITRKNVYSGKESNRISLFNFPAPISDSLEERVLSNWCCDILELRLNKVLRFEKGKTYSQVCRFMHTTLPGLNPSNPSHSIVALTGDPENQQVLEKMLFEQIQDMQTNGPTADEVNDYRNHLSKVYAGSRQTNLHWIDNIIVSTLWNRKHDHFDSKMKQLEKLTSEQVKEQFKKIFHLDNYVVVNHLPDANIQVCGSYKREECHPQSS